MYIPTVRCIYAFTLEYEKDDAFYVSLLVRIPEIQTPWSYLEVTSLPASSLYLLPASACGNYSIKEVAVSRRHCDLSPLPRSLLSVPSLQNLESRVAPFHAIEVVSVLLRDTAHTVEPVEPLQQVRNRVLIELSKADNLAI
jgi:hypothetical protein